MPPAKTPQTGVQPDKPRAKDNLSARHINEITVALTFVPGGGATVMTTSRHAVRKNHHIDREPFYVNRTFLLDCASRLQEARRIRHRRHEEVPGYAT